MTAKKPRRVKTVRYEDYTPLEIKAIQVREWYLALVKAGFKPDIAMTLCVMQEGHPDWFAIPTPEPEDIGTVFDDDEDDD